MLPCLPLSHPHKEKIAVSTNALDSRATTIPDFYSSLEYLVAPIPVPLNNNPTVDEQQRAPGEPVTTPANELNNSLQKLTNLVYLLTERCSGDDQSRTALTLMQAELAHLSVLVRKHSAGPLPERRTERQRSA